MIIFWFLHYLLHWFLFNVDVITTNGITYKSQPYHKECFLCTNCNTQLAGQKFTVKEDKPHCAACYAELFAKRCTACQQPIVGQSGGSTKFISFEDRHWHNECFLCSMCQQSLVGKGFITDEENIICPDCAKTKYWNNGKKGHDAKKM